MKKHGISLILFCLVTYAYSQDTISLAQQKQFISNSKFKLPPSQIISSFTNAQGKWISDEFETETTQTAFESAYKLNVFEYFSLNDLYDSDLKKEVFKKTSEYKLLADSLMKIRTSYLNSIYYLTDFSAIGNYDLKKKGFLISIGTVLPYMCSRCCLPRVINDFEFKQLPIQKIYLHNGINSKNSYDQYVYIPTDDSTGLEIENNRDDIGVLIVFEIKGIIREQFNDQDFINDSIFRLGEPCIFDLIQVGNLRLLLYNKKTDFIYYDKLYPTIQTK